MQALIAKKLTSEKLPSGKSSLVSEAPGAKSLWCRREIRCRREKVRLCLETVASSGNCRFRYSPMKALPGRPVGASLLGASPLGASPRRCRFEDVALKLSLRCGWPSSPCRILFLQGRSLQGRSPPALPQATGRALGQHSGGSIPAVAFRRLCFCSSRAGLIARRWAPVVRCASGYRPEPPPRCPASLGVPLPTPLSGLSRVASGVLRASLRSLLCAPVSLGWGAQAALPSRLAFCGAAFCWAASREAASRGAVSRRAVSRLF